ncbi:hypothetical protein [Flavobacterium kingsejongi]|uniref:Uncharacterized protein n=1 Tax=Flavobacterium kingsejongi TaxID=1678728 RepID=A0A2S1LQU1_9FLAO|nr:hypothetical protein [Flavobacterium kingsejongi]AWG26032.1 hypothetical protein FK004_12750 [Flavobacterium kingsejongi]
MDTKENEPDYETEYDLYWIMEFQKKIFTNLKLKDMQKDFTIQNTISKDSSVILVSNYECLNNVTNWGYHDRKYCQKSTGDVGIWTIKKKDNHEKN